MSEIVIADQWEREQALDPNRSFIVQAPAGSGKTGLITQRFLALLVGVEDPEEIVAITFTRKAAGEMRQRILQSLESAGTGETPSNAHEQITFDLAKRALAQDKAKGWNLVKNPGRLRIQTIDSLCTSLARQMPILSQFGSVPSVTEDAESLYIEAARNTLAELESGESWSDSIEHLIRHMDNRLDKLQVMISGMLSRRDQWLRHVADPNNANLERDHLEQGMERLVTGALASIQDRCPASLAGEIVSMAEYAAGNIMDTENPLACCKGISSLPGADLDDRSLWGGIAHLLLTSDGKWRSRFTKNEGFPAASSVKDKSEKEYLAAMKGRMEDLISSLHSEEQFRQALSALSSLPGNRYDEDEWATLNALIDLLRIAAAHLEIVFAERGEVDFPAVAQAAVRALGSSDDPTDLALSLDYRISHLLIDEFQDTSLTQFELLRGLTAGWMPDDGHSLFLVGDPMQSIYRFRSANPSLFLIARTNGIGEFPLESLQLSVNFRSQQGIIDWVNEKFPKVLAEKDDVPKGAISYASSTAFHDPLPGPTVSIHPSIFRDDAREASEIAAIIGKAKQDIPGGTTAVLVRGRNHLAEIVKSLYEAGISFQAVEIDRLAHRPVIQDLLALTRALVHTGDRIAWLSILRAPFCGLTLNDIYQISTQNRESTVIDLLENFQSVAGLSEEAKKRLARVHPLLKTAVLEHGRCPLRCNIEGVWLALGGPAAVTGKTDIEDAEVFFQLLEKMEQKNLSLDPQDLEKQVEKLFALPNSEADHSVQLMTIHKSKGLEFDTVILPGLGRQPRSDDDALLSWAEMGQIDGETDLLLAPISAEGEAKNKMAAYLVMLDREKQRLEDGRLLYVATTRAKKFLHLFGHSAVTTMEDGLVFKEPVADSLLSRLWPVVKDEFQMFLETVDSSSSPKTEINDSTSPIIPVRSVLSSTWSLPNPPESVRFKTSSGIDSIDIDLIEFDWAGETARQIGIVIHRLYQYLGTSGIEQAGQSNIDNLAKVGRGMLKQLGVPKAEFEKACSAIDIALESAMTDEKCRWILSGKHSDARCELPLSVVGNSGAEHRIIDRTFVSAEGIRWIVDYKSGTHNGSTRDEFMDNEQRRYREQLEDYARIWWEITGERTMLGIYFPLMKGWREWSPFLP
jgi:ATP-dependent helicase/nuclease subunit A